MKPRTEQDEAKLAAGRAAVREYLKDGMKVGLGSGTTAHWVVRGLAERISSDGLEIVGVPTSTATRDLALELGVPLADLNDVGELDVTIDGADEIDPEGDMIKGGGASLLWERIVANASRRMVAVVDSTKVVDALGAFPLAIEIVPFGWKTTHRSLLELFRQGGYGEVELPRRMNGAEAFVTDSGHYLVDAHLGRIADKAFLADRLNRIPGVVENGLFTGVAAEQLVGWPDGRTGISSFPRLAPGR